MNTLRTIRSPMTVPDKRLRTISCETYTTIEADAKQCGQRPVAAANVMS